MDGDALIVFLDNQRLAASGHDLDRIDPFDPDEVRPVDEEREAHHNRRAEDRAEADHQQVAAQLRRSLHELALKVETKEEVAENGQNRNHRDQVADRRGDINGSLNFRDPLGAEGGRDRRLEAPIIRDDGEHRAVQLGRIRSPEVEKLLPGPDAQDDTDRNSAHP